MNFVKKIVLSAVLCLSVTSVYAVITQEEVAKMQKKLDVNNPDSPLVTLNAAIDEVGKVIGSLNKNPDKKVDILQNMGLPNSKKLLGIN